MSQKDNGPYFPFDQVLTGEGMLRANRLPLSEANLRFPQKPDYLLCRVSLPCHSLISSIELEIWS